MSTCLVCHYDNHHLKSKVDVFLRQSNRFISDPKTKEYDGRVITKLIQNYRSHEDLLCVPNELFYDGDLVARAPLDVQNAFIGWSELPKSDFPLIFNGIVGQVMNFEDDDDLTEVI